MRSLCFLLLPPLLSLAWSAGCADDATSPGDDGGSIDGGPAVDSGLRDAGGRDATPSDDAGLAGDAGADPDAGPPAIACCLVDGRCLELTRAECVAHPEQHSLHDMRTCDEVMCPDERMGACCHEDGTCEDGATMDLCTAGGDRHGGEGSTCATTDCESL